MFASNKCPNPLPSLLHPGLESKTLAVTSASLSFSSPYMSSLLWGWGSDASSPSSSSPPWCWGQSDAHGAAVVMLWLVTGSSTSWCKKSPGYAMLCGFSAPFASSLHFVFLVLGSGWAQQVPELFWQCHRPSSASHQCHSKITNKQVSTHKAMSLCAIVACLLPHQSLHILSVRPPWLVRSFPCGKLIRQSKHSLNKKPNTNP